MVNILTSIEFYFVWINGNAAFLTLPNILSVKPVFPLTATGSKSKPSKLCLTRFGLAGPACHKKLRCRRAARQQHQVPNSFQLSLSPSKCGFYFPCCYTGCVRWIELVWIQNLWSRGIVSKDSPRTFCFPFNVLLQHVKRWFPHSCPCDESVRI